MISVRIANAIKFLYGLCKGLDVVEVMEALKTETSILPHCIQVDNGSEFISKDFDKWAYKNSVMLDYS